jgi:hypothetical protein
MSNRIYYAVQAVGIKRPSDLTGNYSSSLTKVQGLQSVGMNTNFNLEPVYQLGQIQLYDNYEEIPEVEITLNKVLDGTPTLYSLTMNSQDGVASSLGSLANTKCGFVLKLYNDTDTAATGDPTASVECSPSYLSSVSYTFPTEGNFTEEVTLVSNDKTWAAAAVGVDDLAPLNTVNEVGTGSNRGILRRGLWSSASVLPTGADSLGGLLSSSSGGVAPNTKINSVKVSMNLGREQIRTLGQRTPYYRYIKFPVEITTEIEVTATEYGDNVGVSGSTNVNCNNPKALTNKTIKIELCDGTKIDLGNKNKLTTVNYTGGDTGGGNATITYSYQTFSEFTYTGPTGNAINT